MKPSTFFLATILGLTSTAACSGEGQSSSTASTGATTTASSASASVSGSGGGGSGGGGVGGNDGAAVTSTVASASVSTAVSSSGSGGAALFTLASTAFVEGAAIPPANACPDPDASPDLTWTAGPNGTLSYAVVLTDTSNDFVHWVIWDIPAATTSLPMGVENKANPAIPAGSKQAKSYDNYTFGYLGPCPPDKHTYQFEVFALDAATLPGVTTDSVRTAVRDVIVAHSKASATLSGTFTP